MLLKRVCAHTNDWEGRCAESAVSINVPVTNLKPQCQRQANRGQGISNHSLTRVSEVGQLTWVSLPSGRQGGTNEFELIGCYGLLSPSLTLQVNVSQWKFNEETQVKTLHRRHMRADTVGHFDPLGVKWAPVMTNTSCWV